MGSPVKIPGIKYDPANPGDRLINRADGSEAASEIQIKREALVQKIRLSRVQMLEYATLPSEMAQLAAQQVNEIRLRSLETPKEVGWGEIGLELALSFFLNSSFGEKWMAKFLQATIGKALSHERVFRALPKSVFGTQVFKDAQLQKQLARQFVTEAATRSVAGQEQIKALQQAEQLLANELKKYAKLKGASTDDIKLYAGWINELIGQPKTISAVPKAIVAAVKKAGGSRPKFTTTDGSSVSVMEHFSNVARAQRLQIEANHIGYEYIAQTFPLSDNTIALLEEHFNIDQVFDAQSEAIKLEQASTDLRIRIEAMIWALHYDFSVKRNTPEIDPSNPSSLDKVYRVSPPIPATTVQYLFDRFGKLIEAWLIESGNRFPLGWDQAPNTSKAIGLHLYLGSIGDEFK